MSVLSIGPESEEEQPIAILHGTGPADGMFVNLNPREINEAPLRAPDGCKVAIEPTHLPNARDVIMVGGKSGSGKSHIARNFAIRYSQLWPKRSIYFISYLKEDPTIDKISDTIERIPPEELSDETHDIEFFTDSLTIIDDVEGYERKNKEIHNRIQSVVDMIATMGRHNSSSIVVSSHLLTDYKRTRLFLGEANHFVVFAHGASQNQLYNLLCRYSGLDKSDVDKLRSLPSRWVCVRTIFPLTVMHEQGVYLLRPQQSSTEPKKMTMKR
jgi:hypothetical protein